MPKITVEPETEQTLWDNEYALQVLTYDDYDAQSDPERYRWDLSLYDLVPDVDLVTDSDSWL